MGRRRRFKEECERLSKERRRSLAGLETQYPKLLIWTMRMAWKTRGAPIRRAPVRRAPIRRPFRALPKRESRVPKREEKTELNVRRKVFEQVSNLMLLCSALSTMFLKYCTK